MTYYPKEMEQVELLAEAQKLPETKFTEKGGEGVSINNFWEESGSKFRFRADALTMRNVLRIYQLDPAPQEIDNINDYIVLAIQKHDNRYFSCFLHYHESRLNSRIRRFLVRGGT